MDGEEGAPLPTANVGGIWVDEPSPGLFVYSEPLSGDSSPCGCSLPGALGVTREPSCRDSSIHGRGHPGTVYWAFSRRNLEQEDSPGQF